MSARLSPSDMTTDDAIETLGDLVSRAGGEGYEALEVIKDFISEHSPQQTPEDLKRSFARNADRKGRQRRADARVEDEPSRTTLPWEDE